MCNVLIVDDEEDVRETLRGSLADAGYQVKSAANEKEAMGLVWSESFDFACVDLRLWGDEKDDESGYSLGLALTKISKEIRIILFSGDRSLSTKQINHMMRYQGFIKLIEKTPNIDQDILKTLEKEKTQKHKSKGDTTRLLLSLSIGQPLFIRAQGSYVCSRRTVKIFDIPFERYARKTELAKAEKNQQALRFQIKDIGINLWKDIFKEHSEINETYQKARMNNIPLSLRFEASAEFLRLPLEFMCPDEHSEYEDSDYFVLQHSFVRFICGVIPKRKPISPEQMTLAKKLRILIIASNTHKDGQLPLINGVDIETQKLSSYLNQEKNCVPVEINLIPTERATKERVKDILQKSKYDIIHYAGHGQYNFSSPEESCLYFWSQEQKQGEVVPMKATELNMLLKQSETRLVYLSCCEGTAIADSAALLDDDFLGLSDAVIKAGIPSVIGFRWPVSDNGAYRLALAFYHSLLEQGSPELALLDARCELAALDRNDPAWLSPILIHQE